MSARPSRLLALLVLLLGCGADDGSPPLASGTGTGTTGVATSTTGVADLSDGGSGPGGPGLDCPAFTPPEGPFTAPDPDTTTLDASTMVCAGIGNLPMAGATVEVYYPGDPNEDPADGRFPVVVFHHGNGLDYQQYDFLIEELQTSGFVVLNVSAAPTAPSSFSVLAAIDSIRCALRWFYLGSTYFEDVGSCELVTAGHSRGGAAAQIVRGALLNPNFEPDLLDLNVRAMVLLASSAPGIPTPLSAYPPSQAVPLLALGSSSDEDVPGEVLTAYDRMVPESDMDDLAGSVSTPYKGQVWVYDLPHGGFGGGIPLDGTGRLTASEYEDKGHTITNAYVDRFLRWQVFGEDHHDFFVGRALPPEVEEPQWWAHLPAYRGAPDVCDAIGSSTPCEDLGCTWTGVACEGTPSCDAFETEQDCLDAECVWDLIPPPSSVSAGCRSC